MNIKRKKHKSKLKSGLLRPLFNAVFVQQILNHTPVNPQLCRPLLMLTCQVLICAKSFEIHYADAYTIDDYQIYSKKSVIHTHFLDDGQFILQDGVLVMGENPTNNADAGLLLTADINGLENGPNAWGHDLFTFEVLDNRLVPSGAKGTHYDLESHPSLCSETSASTLNGIACTEKALSDPDYFKNLP